MQIVRLLFSSGLGIMLLSGSVYAKCSEADMQQMQKRGQSLTQIMENCNKRTSSLEFLDGTWEVDDGGGLGDITMWKFEIQGDSFLFSHNKERGYPQRRQITNYDLIPPSFIFSYRIREVDIDLTQTYKLNILSPTEMEGKVETYDRKFQDFMNILDEAMCADGSFRCESNTQADNTYTFPLRYIKKRK